MQLVILAAGMGSRFGGLKQLEPMDNYGNFLLDYSVYDAQKAGFTSVIFIIKKDFFKEFKETIGSRVEKIVKVEYAFQDLNDLPCGYKCPADRVKPWGTAHAIYAARDLIREDFIIINGDDFYGRETYQVAHDYLASLPKNSLGKYANVTFKAINTMTKNGAVKRGVVFANKNGYLDRLVESSIEIEDEHVKCTPLEGGESFNVNKEQPVSMNLFIFNTDLISQLVARFPAWLKNNINDPKAEFLIPSFVDELVNEGQATVKLLNTPSKWFGVTYREDKPGVVKALKQLVKKGVYKEGLY